MSEFSGYLKDKALAEVLKDLWNDKSTGWLSVVTDKLDLGNIYLRDGIITYANIANQQERTGDILVRQGYITEEQLQRAIRTQQDNSDRLLGSILVDLNFISNEDLKEVLKEQITETIFVLLNWDNGYYNFAPDRAPDTTYIPVEIDTNDIIREGTERKELWRKIRSVIPNNEVIPLQNDARAREFDLMTLSLIEEQIFYSVDGTKSVAQIINEMGMSEFQTLEILLGLYNLGLIQMYDVEADRKKKAQQEITRLLENGKAQIEAGSYNSAFDLFRRCVELDPDHLESRFYYGLCALMTGEFDEAETSFRQIREVYNRNFAVTNNLALCLEKLGKEQDEVVKMWSRCIKLQPENPKTNINLALYLYHVKNYFLAADQFRMAQGKNEKDAAVLYYLGVIACHENDIKKAIEYFDKAVRTNPNAGQFRNNLGWALTKAGNLEEAKIELQYALQIDPNDWRAYVNLGNVYLEQHALEKAEKAYQAALALQPKSGYILFKLGTVFVHKKDRNQALKYWQQAAAVSPNNEALQEAIQKLQQVPA
ncbi:MAG: tetratricopeptide repeat protein [Gemmatimonadetes bacterium]|nr:MAG: tetratricopeptide repeat protein [Gemmatimonadota bacterium]